jgi:hypothetical protein
VDATPGGNPDIAVPGNNPTPPLITVGPVFVIALPARTAKLAAVPKRGWVAANAAIGHAPRTRAETTIERAIIGRFIVFIEIVRSLESLWSAIRRACRRRAKLRTDSEANHKNDQHDLSVSWHQSYHN